MSKQSILKSADPTLSPSQVYLDKLSSGVFRDLFSSGSCSYNGLLQREGAQKSPKRSPYRRAKVKVKGGATFAKRKTPNAAAKKVHVTEGTCTPVESSGTRGLPAAAACMAVVGSGVHVSSRVLPKLRETCTRAKGPCSLRAACTREAEGGRRLCVLSAVKPTNVESEKLRFFKSGFSCNPQFEYSSPASSLALARHSHASERFLTQVSRAGVPRRWRSRSSNLGRLVCCRRCASWRWRCGATAATRHSSG